MVYCFLKFYLYVEKNYVWVIVRDIIKLLIKDKKKNINKYDVLYIVLFVNYV